ncbi:hypothetical protein [Eisenibacter elegans]|jgi:hypothetical protein|uniref:hypothetical protein n=1 Tax=Eisenibacter elegans TaxID=997 RepID=UPI001376C252|nr:hypothetical protein [Eisenibacter elegans]
MDDNPYICASVLLTNGFVWPMKMLFFCALVVYALFRFHRFLGRVIRWLSPFEVVIRTKAKPPLSSTPSATKAKPSIGEYIDYEEIKP